MRGEASYFQPSNVRTGQSQPFSLTPALYRWEREERRPAPGKVTGARLKAA